MNKLRLGFCVAIWTLVALSTGAHAQTILQAPSIRWGSTYMSPGPVSIISYDTSTGLPCIAGSTATCPLVGSGGGGGSTTPFAPAGTYATLAVTTSSARVALPLGTAVVIYNTGTAVSYVQLGSGSVTATTSNDAIQPGSWIEFTVGANVDLAAITASGSTSLILSGGAGLASGAGGGSSGGGGGNAAASLTGSAVPTSAGYTGFNVSGNLVGVSAGNPLPITASGGAVGLLGGSQIVGKVGIDQTTPGTTNGVVVNSSALPTGAATAANQATGNTNTTAIAAIAGTTTSGICPSAATACDNSQRQAAIEQAVEPLTIIALDIATTTSGGTAVTALNAGHRKAGGVLVNPIEATINLCINEQGTASGTTTAGPNICIVPGQSYSLAPSAAAVSVITSDASHPYGGYGEN